jgi:hypothetical protein
MHDVGRSLVRFAERHPDHPVARRPGLRHRVKAAGLTALTMAGIRTRGVQHETWRFLCHEASREGFWDAVDAGGGGSADRGGAPALRIGRRLARLASRDEDARMPADGPAAAAGRRAVSA